MCVCLINGKLSLVLLRNPSKSCRGFLVFDFFTRCELSLVFLLMMLRARREIQDLGGTKCGFFFINFLRKEKRTRLIIKKGKIFCFHVMVLYIDTCQSELDMFFSKLKKKKIS